jgi:hypothetical protein
MQAQSECKNKYYFNPTTFLQETKQLRKEQQYDEIIQIIEKKVADSVQLWHYYQLGCMYALKGDTMRPFYYIYKYINLQEFAEDILTDSDWEVLYSTEQWHKLKDSIISLYLAKYPDITDKKLSIKLWLMGIEDQRYRTLSINNKSWSLFPDNTLSGYKRKQEKENQKKNEKFIMDLLKRKLFPTYAMVGEEASNAAILVIQHSGENKLFKKALPLAEQAAKQKQINTTYYAIMVDRYLAQQGKKQLYGTQYWSMIKKDANGYYTRSSDYFFVPIEDGKNINIRRKEIGLDTIEEMAERLGFTYQYNPEDDKLSFKKISKRNSEKAYKQHEEKQ